MKNVDKLIARALECAKSGDLARAEKIARTILEDDPSNFDALHIYGNARLERDDLRSATSLLIEVVKLDPSFPPAQMNLANCLAGSGNHKDAVLHFEAAIKLRPNYAEAIYNRALSLKELERADEAIKSLRAAATATLGEPRIYKLLADLLIEDDDLDGARAVLEAGISDLPKSAELLVCMGCVLLRLKDEAKAAEYFARARKLGPLDAEAHRRRAEAFRALERLQDALDEYSRAIERERGDARLYNSRAELYDLLGKESESTKDKDLAYGLHIQAANVRFASGNSHSALKNMNAALDFHPEDVTALNTRATVLNEMAKYPEALKDYEKVRELGGADPAKLALICHLKSRTVDWSGLPELVDEVRTLGLEGAPLAPFHVIPLVDDPVLHLQVARTQVSAAMPQFKPRPLPAPPPHPKIRIGYFSADFFTHPVLQLIRGVYANHDRDRFHVAAYSLTKNKDASYHQIKPAFDAFHNLESASDDEITTLARKEKVDIAIDLTGFTNEARFGIFAYKAAPIQANFLGYPGTLGADFMDYIIADPVIIPPELREHYSEKVAYMPCYQPNDRLRPLPRPNELRSDHKLPENGFVFCCFNDTYKITPERFDLWMSIMNAVDGSVLWLLVRDEHTQANFTREAAARGVDPKRIIFAPRLNHDYHISRHQLVDVFLDTGPYNAHTTTSDALWAGVPVLTLAGRSFASRVAASLVTRAGAPELVTNTADEYVDLAVRLARDPELLQGIKNKIRAAREGSPLFDVVRFTRDLEALYVEMMRRHRDGLPPDHIMLPG
ncbi:MAG: tetratricopeptide repeat protein [Beijerinckiaceae bacterium]|nr:tetratricopeptide repeat protein [Beijerinckiaceae bacterium]